MISNKIKYIKSVDEHGWGGGGGERERERDWGNKTGSPSKSVAFNGYCREPETGYQTHDK